MKTEELVDIVDINDIVVGKTTKYEAHEKGLPHRVATIFIFDENNRLLVQHRKKDGLLDHSVGGHVDAGETYDEAAIREMTEEVGLKTELSKIGSFYADERLPRNKLQTIHYFGLYETKIKNNELGAMALSKDEVIEMKPMSIEEIADSMTEEPTKWTTGFKATLNFYIKTKKLAINSIPLK